MIEAVGHQFYDTYFDSCSRLLKPEGAMLLQAITIADHRYEQRAALGGFHPALHLSRKLHSFGRGC